MTEPISRGHDFYQPDPAAIRLGGAAGTLLVTAGLAGLLLAGAGLAVRMLPPVLPGAVGELIWSAAYAGLVLTGGFGVPLLALLAIVRLSGARAGDQLSAAPRFRWQLMAAGFAVTGAITGSGLLLAGPGGAGGPARLAVAAPEVIAGLALVLLAGFAVQSLLEELWLRGWLVRRLRGHGLGLLAAMVVSWAVFVALHWRPGLPVAALAGVGCMGAALTVAAWRSGGLEAGWGAHLANNLTVALLGGALVGPQPVPDPGLAIGAALVQGFGLLGVVELWGRPRGPPGGALPPLR